VTHRPHQQLPVSFVSITSPGAACNRSAAEAGHDPTADRETEEVKGRSRSQPRRRGWKP
jgi:hypothetical protein